MKYRSRIIIAMVSAALSYGSLIAIAGPEKLKEQWQLRHHCDRLHHDHHHLDCPEHINQNQEGNSTEVK